MLKNHWITSAQLLIWKTFIFSNEKQGGKKIVRKESQIFLLASTVHSTQEWNIGPACNSVILLPLITMPSVAMIVLRWRPRRFFANNSFRCDTNHAVMGDCLPMLLLKMRRYSNEKFAECFWQTRNNSMLRRLSRLKVILKFFALLILTGIWTWNESTLRIFSSSVFSYF